MDNFIDLPDDIKYAIVLKGLNENVVKKISMENDEPERMLNHRLQSLKIFESKKMPDWGVDLSDLDWDSFVFFAKPEAMEQYTRDRNEVPAEIKDKFEKLGIPEAERKFLSGAGGQIDSQVFYHKLKKTREDAGIIFEDMNSALKKYPEIVKKYFMKLVPNTDHKFAALHGAVRSGGTYIYIPQGIKLTQPLQTYFRMNVMFGGQFEHTLIILEDDAEGSYIEGCSAPKYNQRSLHAGCVEIYVGKNSKMRYSSVENWSTDTYNLNTKRAILQKDAYIEWIGGNFGSYKTMLYPMTILKGQGSKADHLSVTFASRGQVQDIGNKVIHLGSDTTSNILTKSVCKDGGINTYRGMVKIAETAKGCVSNTKCDATLIDEKSVSDTIPTIDVQNPSAEVFHEASAGKLDENVIFYIMSRGVSLQEAKTLAVNGFLNPIIKKLPLEYSAELNKLIGLEFEG